MIIDGNIFWGESLYRNSQNVLEIQDEMKKNNVEKAVLRPLKPLDYNYDKANQNLGEMIAKHTQFYGFARVNPLEKNAPQQIEKAIREYGLCGVHLHPWEDNFQINSPFIYETFDIAQKLDIPLYISTGYPNVSEVFQLMEVLKLFPTVRAVATHAGQLDMSGGSFDDVLIAAKETENLYFDFSGCYRRDFMEQLVHIVGDYRTMFGSNSPYMSMSMEIDRILFTALTDSQKERILGKNMIDFIG